MYDDAHKKNVLNLKLICNIHAGYYASLLEQSIAGETGVLI